MSRKIIIVIYYFILVICIGISTSLSFKGFIRSLDEYTVPFVAVIALGLFAAGTLLQLGRDNKSISEQFLALFLFIIFATFSTASNFTHIYTQEMKERVETAAFNDEFSKFKKNLGMMVQVLEGNQAQNQVKLEQIAQHFNNQLNIEIDTLKARITSSEIYTINIRNFQFIESELLQLRTQVLDPLRAGCGERCRAHLENIEKQVPYTDAAKPNTTNVAKLNNWLRAYNESIWQRYCTTEQKFVEYHRLLSLAGDGSNSPCSGIQDYNSKYPRSQLEKLRLEVEITKPVNEKSLKADLSRFKKVATKLNTISSEVKESISSPTNTVASLSISIPTTIKEANEMFNTESGQESSVSKAEITARSSLLDSFNNSEFMSITLSISDGSEINHDISRNLEAREVLRPDSAINGFFMALDGKQTQLVNAFQSVEADHNLEFQELNVSNGEIGEIRQALHDGFIKKPDPKTTLYALILGAIFDLIPILFALVAFHGYKPKEPNEYDPVLN
jgi:hypothetical protein